MSSPRLCPLPQGPQEPFLIAGRWHSQELCPAPGSRLASATGARWLRDVPSGVTHPGDSTLSGLERGRCVTEQLLSLQRGEEPCCPSSSLAVPPEMHFWGKKLPFVALRTALLPACQVPVRFTVKREKSRNTKSLHRSQQPEPAPTAASFHITRFWDLGDFWGIFAVPHFSPHPQDAGARRLHQHSWWLLGTQHLMVTAAW